MSPPGASEKFLRMTRSPVEPLICQLAIPTIVSNLVSSFYNMADTYFIGKISTSASAAAGVSFALMAVIQAAGFFFGQGSGNNISRELGKRKEKSAAMLASVGFFSALLTGCAIMAMGLLFLEPLAWLLGSTETILPHAIAYMRWILIGAPWMAASIVLNNQLRFEGSSFYGMIGLASGAVLNVALDPLFIFVFDMGIAGAALATILSQFVSFMLLLLGCARSGNVPIRLRNFRPSLACYRMIANGGTPSLCRQGVGCVAILALNTAARPFGDAAIAAMAIVSRISHFTDFILIGFGQGFQPVCGFNYGAKQYDRVRIAFWFCVKVTAVFLLVLSIAGFFVAPFLIEWFRRDPEVVRIGGTALRLHCLTLPLASWGTISNMMMQTVGKVFRASFLGAARRGVFLIPFVLLLPQLIGILGVQAAQPASDLISFAIAIPLQCGLLREMRRESDRAR